MKLALTRAAACGIFVFALFFLPARAWANGDLVLPPAAPVVDEYGLLSSSQVKALDTALRNAKAHSGIEISIFIVSSLRGMSIEDFSVETAEKWKLGRKKEDRAFLLTVAPRERKMRIEVGYGLEGELTDAFARQVLDNTMRPLFKEGRYYEGISASLLRIQEKIPLGLDSGEMGYVDNSFSPPPFLLAFFLIMIFFSILARIARWRNPSAYGRHGGIGSYYGGSSWGSGSSWGGGSSGSSGGGSWGGGGGSFGGGGSSSSW